jgi:hydroxymethylpyrimidine/phosphomethylpyrimidine kinase
MKELPPVLTVAGSDNSSGAGVQADLKTITALGGYGLTAVTCVVAEIPGKVTSVHPIPPRIVAEQIQLCFEAFPVRALKTGMLFSTEILTAVASTLAALSASHGQLPLVVDPVMVATSGHRLLNLDALAAYQTMLFPQALVVTPNLDEAAVLSGSSIQSRSELLEAGRALAREHGVAFLMKGGHLKGEVAADVLVLPKAGEHWFEAPYVKGVSTHGTGCTYSAAIAAELGKGRELLDAVAKAKRFISRTIQNHLTWVMDGRATEALNHFAVEH